MSDHSVHPDRERIFRPNSQKGRSRQAPERQKDKQVNEAVRSQDCEGKGEQVESRTVIPIPLMADEAFAEDGVSKKRRVIPLNEGTWKGGIKIARDELGGRIHAPIEKSQNPVGHKDDPQRPYPLPAVHSLFGASCDRTDLPAPAVIETGRAR